MTRQYSDQMTRAYGLFTPGSAARSQRMANAERGLATCHCCGTAFDPEQRVARLYCSEACARADDPRYRRAHPIVAAPGEFVVDLTECGCGK